MTTPTGETQGEVKRISITQHYLSAKIAPAIAVLALGVGAYMSMNPPRTFGVEKLTNHHDGLTANINMSNSIQRHSEIARTRIGWISFKIVLFK